MSKVAIEKIKIHSWFNLAESDYPYETYDFVIDLESKKAFFKEKKIYSHCIRSMLNEENRNAFNNIHKYYSEEIFTLGNINMDKLLSNINNFKTYCENNPSIDSNLQKPVFYTITIIYNNEQEDYFKIYNEFPAVFIDFVDVINNLVGFDVFNFDNLRYLVTEHDYNISENKIEDKLTGHELILKRIDFSKECGQLFKSTKNSFHINLNKNELIDYDKNKTNLSSMDVEKLLCLIKKHGVFKWNSIEYSNNAINKYAAVFDGCVWRLSLAFDGGQVLNFGGHHNYPDTYIDFRDDLMNLFGKELLCIDSPHK